MVYAITVSKGSGIHKKAFDKFEDAWNEAVALLENNGIIQHDNAEACFHVQEKAFGTFFAEADCWKVGRITNQGDVGLTLIWKLDVL